ncbi:hypothetical protein Q8A67_021610 [Cirrhinus molitorella]|uniref:Uncharacterized protein n=1 Tax=Cirrhinus molitorella TaxID=172907 RepID=A0AA88PA97_9TELE|nr:hypothetical protein Q8A67_021610 [Cirrhinus molitorella]
MTGFYVRAHSATIDSIYRVAQDGGILPDITLDGTVANLLSLNSSTALNLQYAAVQQSLTTDQLAALDSNLTSIFGQSTSVSYGGVGVVALALSFLLEALVSSIIDKTDGVTTNPFKKPFGSDNSSEIGSIASEYLQLVSKKANDVDEMGEITELYDQKLKYALIELYESMTVDHQLNTNSIKQWINGAAIHLHMRIHGIRLASVPKGTAESLRLSYRTGLARLIQLYTGYLRQYVRERSTTPGPPIKAGFLIIEPGKKVRHRVVHNTCQSQTIASAVGARILTAQNIGQIERFFDEAGQILDRLLQQRDTFELHRQQRMKS